MNLGTQTPGYRIRGTLTGQPGIFQIFSTFLDTVRRDSLPHCHGWPNVFKERDQEEMLIQILELSIAPSMNNRIVPPHTRPELESRGLYIDDFKPLTKEEMMAHLD